MNHNLKKAKKKIVSTLKPWKEITFISEIEGNEGWRLHFGSVDK